HLVVADERALDGADAAAVAVAHEGAPGLGLGVAAAVAEQRGGPLRGALARVALRGRSGQAVAKERLEPVVAALLAFTVAEAEGFPVLVARGAPGEALELLGEGLCGVLDLGRDGRGRGGEGRHGEACAVGVAGPAGEPVHAAREDGLGVRAE